MSPLLEVTEDTPPDMLAGSMDLRLVIPDGKRVRMSVDRRTPMMDLLVQVTTAYKISPAGYVLQPYGETGLLPYKPSTPIGALDTWIVHIVPKNQSLQNPSNKINLKQIIPPFEQTLRFQVNLPRNQLYVTRVSGRCSMRDILHQACSEKNLDPSKYTLRHPKQLDKPLYDELSIAEYGHNQVTMLSIKNLPTAVLTEDILQMNSAKYKTQSDSGSGSAASSVSPVVPVQPSKPLRKRRPAPKPPVQQRKEQSQKQQSETIICHSRTSSDSSGYHEASVLSESPDSNNSSLPDSLPRRSKLPTAETNNSRETNKLSRSLSNLHQASTSASAKSTLKPAQSVSCLAPSRKKKPAPAPPVAIAEEKEDKSATLPPCSRLMDPTEERKETPVNKKPAPVRGPSPVNTVDINKEIIRSKAIPPINCYSSSPSKTVEKLCPSQPVAKLLMNFETPLNFSNSRQSPSENPSIPVGHVKSLSEKFVISSESKSVINKIRQQTMLPNNKYENGFMSENNRLFRQNNFSRTMRTFSECSFSSIPESLGNRKSSCVSDSVSLIPSNLMEELEARISGRSNNVKMILKHFETVNSVCNDESESYQNSKNMDRKEPLNGFNESLISSEDVTSERVDDYLPRNADCEEQEAIFFDDRKEPNFYNGVADQIHLENDITSMDDEMQDEPIETVRNSPDMDSMDLTNGQNDETVCYDVDNVSGTSDSYNNIVTLDNSENEHSFTHGLFIKKEEFIEEPTLTHWAINDYCGNDFIESYDINCSSSFEEPSVNINSVSENHLEIEQTDLSAKCNDMYDDISVRDNNNEFINDSKSNDKYDDEETKIVKTHEAYGSDSDSNGDTCESLSQFQTFNSSSLEPNLYETNEYLTKCNNSDGWNKDTDCTIFEHENSVNNAETPLDNDNICENKAEFNQNESIPPTSKFSLPPYMTTGNCDIMIPEERTVQEVANSKIDGRRESLFSNNSAIYESMESIQEKIEENKLTSKEIKFKQKIKTVTFCEPKKELDSISENEYSKPSKREKIRFSSPLKLGLWTRKGKALLFGKKKKTQEHSWNHVDNFSFCDCPDPDVVYIRVPDPSENLDESRMKRNESPMSDNSDHTYMAMNGIKVGIPEEAYEMSECELVHTKLSELLNSRPDDFL